MYYVGGTEHKLSTRVIQHGSGVNRNVSNCINQDFSAQNHPILCMKVIICQKYNIHLIALKANDILRCRDKIDYYVQQCQTDVMTKKKTLVDDSIIKDKLVSIIWHCSF